MVEMSACSSVKTGVNNTLSVTVCSPDTDFCFINVGAVYLLTRGSFEKISSVGFMFHLAKMQQQLLPT